MSKIAWIDLETTGFDAEKGVILEVACILTDMDGKEEATFHGIVGHDRDSILGMMDDKCLKMHLGTNLLSEVWYAWRQTKMPTCEGLLIERMTRDLMARAFRNIGLKEAVFLGGSSVHFDRLWISKYMEKLDKALHTHHHIDVSVWKTAHPEIWEMIKEEMGEMEDNVVAHRAMADIQYSLNVYKASKKVLARLKWPTILDDRSCHPGDQPPLNDGKTFAQNLIDDKAIDDREAREFRGSST